MYGGLAVLGVLAYNYYSKNKKTGYSNASGVFSKTNASACRVCIGDSNNYYAVWGQCRSGDKCKG